LDELYEALALCEKEKESVTLCGISTHLAGAEVHSNYSRVKAQIEKFKKIKNEAMKFNIKKPIFHMACSAALVRFPETEMDMVRIGIMNYGFWPNQETMISYLERNHLKENPLERVISWKSKVISLKMVKQGEFIGY